MPAKSNKPPLVAGKYHLRDRLGQGAHGTVYRATHVDLGEDVALKLLKPEVAADAHTQRRFLREVKLATSFVHKYAVQLRDFGREPNLGSLYFTMDYIKGPTFDGVLEREGALDERPAIHLIGQLLEVLEEAHKAGIVHRDLKPANLILTSGHDGEAEIRVLDFGVAKAVSATRKEALGNAPTLTITGVLVGTLQYMSPEQAQGLELDGRSDLYSVGVILYELLTGEKPIQPDPKATNRLQSFLFKLTTVLPKPVRQLAPHVTPELEAVVMRALEKSVDKRWPSAREFRRALKKVPAHKAKKRLRTGQKPEKRPPAQTQSDRLTRSSSTTVEKHVRPPAPTLPEPRGPGSTSSATRRGLRETHPLPARKSSRRPKLKDPAKSAKLESHSKRTRKAGNLPEGVVPGPRKGEFINERDGSILLWVPHETFTMGAHLSKQGRLSGLFGDKNTRSDHPQHQVTLSRGYFVGKTPVTWKQYRQFCKKTGRTAPTRVNFRASEITDRHPAVNLSWNEAVAYCRWAGLRLPTEAEWELAARGTDARPYPWGESEPNAKLANFGGHPSFGGNSTSPVGTFPRGSSPCGCLDMVGNVWEWVQDWYGDYSRRDLKNPRGPRGGSARVVRGGCWQSDAEECLVTRRFAVAPHKRKNVLGFRVCRSG